MSRWGSFVTVREAFQWKTLDEFVSKKFRASGARLYSRKLFRTMVSGPVDQKMCQSRIHVFTPLMLSHELTYLANLDQRPELVCEDRIVHRGRQPRESYLEVYRVEVRHTVGIRDCRPGIRGARGTQQAYHYTRQHTGYTTEVRQWIIIGDLP